MGTRWQRSVEGRWAIGEGGGGADEIAAIDKCPSSLHQSLYTLIATAPYPIAPTHPPTPPPAPCPTPSPPLPPSPLARPIPRRRCHLATPPRLPIATLAVSPPPSYRLKSADFGIGTNRVESANSRTDSSRNRFTYFFQPDCHQSDLNRLIPSRIGRFLQL